MYGLTEEVKRNMGAIVSVNLELSEPTVNGGGIVVGQRFNVGVLASGSHIAGDGGAGGWLIFALTSTGFELPLRKEILVRVFSG